ncbi:Rieske (2Fe-2S) protein [Rhodocista pekingensis]|uniref:Rieske (2Fe-2S) protein n=1 Tax=Rhodocista pekingensis TaxID=201185 RepID=A0ABW2KWV7_9PROT
MAGGEPTGGASLRLCRLADIPDGQARGFVTGSAADGGTAPRRLLVARRGDRVFAYVNSCPHAGVPLDWQPDRFMSPDGAFLHCATHGARFRVEDGVCVHGPCAGRGLTPVPVGLEDGQVVVTDAGGVPADG